MGLASGFSGCPLLGSALLNNHGPAVPLSHVYSGVEQFLGPFWLDSLGFQVM